MGPPAVVVLGIGPQRPIEMPPTEDEGPVEALGPDRLDHPLGMGIRIRCSEGRADDLRTDRGIDRWPARTPAPTVGPPVSYTHLRAHETVLDLVRRLLLEKKKKNK